MHPLPTDALHEGARRVRVVTASLGVAALLATGVMTWVVASEETTAGAVETTTGGHGSTSGGSTGTSGSGSTLLQPDHSHRTPHASSGGS